MDVVILALYVYQTVPYLDEVKQCSEDMHSMGMMFLIYFSWFISRNLIAIGCCWFSKKPKDGVSALKACFCCIDGIALTIVTIMCTKILVSDEANICSMTSMNINNFWKTCLAMLILSYLIMLCSLCWCCMCSCVMVMFCILVATGQLHQQGRL